MAGESIAVGIIIGMLTGVILGFFIAAFKKSSQVKNSIGKIRNQKATYMLDGKTHDFIGSIDKDLKKASGRETKRGFFSKLKRDKKNFPSAPIEDYGVRIDDEKERRPSKKSKKKENKKHPYKKKKNKKV